LERGSSRLKRGSSTKQKVIHEETKGVHGLTQINTDPQTGRMWIKIDQQKTGVHNKEKGSTNFH
jgi:hypothetical protein